MMDIRLSWLSSYEGGMAVLSETEKGRMDLIFLKDMVCFTWKVGIKNKNYGQVVMVKSIFNIYIQY